jgi:sortase (surface protein transpeptidase)
MNAVLRAAGVTRPLGRVVACLIVAATAQGFLVSSGSATTQIAGVGAKASCARPAHGFVPTRAQIPSIGHTVKVVQVNRTSSGAIGAVPATSENKWVMSMDPQNRPGSHHGSVLLAGHTWPDGSALGNAMLANLEPGDQIVLTGAHGTRACYQITERDSYPADRVPTRQAFRSNGPERVVIVACSGIRRGPGNRSERTLWYGSPVKAPTPPPPPSTPPPSTPPPNGGLLGGLLGGL